jgi:hypothetical protein
MSKFTLKMPYDMNPRNILIQQGTISLSFLFSNVRLAQKLAVVNTLAYLAPSSVTNIKVL